MTNLTELIKTEYTTKNMLNVYTIQNLYENTDSEILYLLQYSENIDTTIELLNLVSYDIDEVLM